LYPTSDTDLVWKGRENDIKILEVFIGNYSFFILSFFFCEFVRQQATSSRGTHGSIQKVIVTKEERSKNAFVSFSPSLLPTIAKV